MQRPPEHCARLIRACPGLSGLRSDLTGRFCTHYNNKIQNKAVACGRDRGGDYENNVHQRDEPLRPL